MELQDALSVGMRLTARAHLADIEAFRKGGGNGETPLLPEELNQELFKSSCQLSILTERVADDALREAIKGLRQAMTEVLMAKDENQSTSALQNTASSFENTMGQLGQVLRRSY